MAKNKVNLDNTLTGALTIYVYFIIATGKLIVFAFTIMLFLSLGKVVLNAMFGK